MKSKLLDVNVLAIFLVEDHPGHPHVASAVEAGLAGKYRLLAPDMLPLRARWVMTSKWGIPKRDADAVLAAFLEQPRVTYVGATRETLQRAFALAGELGHDVYDTFYLALALDHGATGLLTTDTKLRGPCERVGLEYGNPVPTSVLRKFAGFRP